MADFLCLGDERFFIEPPEQAGFFRLEKGMLDYPVLQRMIGNNN